MLVFKSGYLEPCAGSAFCLEMWSFLGGMEIGLPLSQGGKGKATCLHFFVCQKWKTDSC